jgi:uncharacterized protein YceH (UPF0502 family)
MAQLPTLDDLERAMQQLIDRRYAARLERRPGQKEERFAHLLGGAEEPTSDASRAAVASDGDLAARVAALEAAVASLRSELAALRSGSSSAK